MKPNLIVKGLRAVIFNPLLKWINARKDYSQLRKIIGDFKSKNIINKTIVINTARNLRGSIDTEFFLGLKLALNGAKVKILLDDGILLHWDSTDVNDFKKLRNVEKKIHNPYYLINGFDKLFSYKFLDVLVSRCIRKKAIKSYKVENLEFIYYSEFSSELELDYENIEELKKHAESSLIRFQRSSDFDYNQRDVKYYYLLSLKNAIVSRAIGSYIYNHIKPDYYINAHGIYSTHGPVFEHLKKKGIKSYVWCGSNLHTLDITNSMILDTPAQTMGSSSFWEEYKNTFITDEMRNAVKEWFIARTEGKSADMIAGTLLIKDNIYNVDKNDGYKYHIALFPNIIWDGNIRDKHIAFNDYLDWIYSTIDYFKGRNDVKFYIKSHPNELNICKPKDRIIQILEKNIDINSIKNLVLISPESKINTYEFIKSGIDLCVVYDGFLAVELKYLKIPTIMCVKGGFSYIEGADYTITNKEQYFEFLKNIDETIDSFNKNYPSFFDTIVRFLYWYLFYNIVKMPTQKYYYEYGLSLRHLTKNDLKAEKRLLELFR